MDNTLPNSDKPIFVAVKKGDLSFIIKNTDKIHKKDCAENTLLHTAAWHGHLDIVQWLLNNGGDSITEKNTEGANALHFAAQGGHLEIIQHLLGSGHFLPTDTGEDDASCLHYAAMSGQIKVLEWMLEQPLIEVDAEDQAGETALHYAARAGQTAAIQCLVLNHNADISAQDSEGHTAIHYAAYCGHLSIIQWLISHRATQLYVTTTNNHNLLHLAAEGGRLEIVKWLVKEKQFTIDNQTDENQSAINIAMEHVANNPQCLEVVQFFYEEHARSNLPYIDNTLSHNQITKITNHRKELISSSSFILKTLIGFKLPTQVAFLIVNFLNGIESLLGTNALNSMTKYTHLKEKYESFDTTFTHLNFDASTLEHGNVPTVVEFNMLKNRVLIEHQQQQIQSQQSQIKALEDKVEQLMQKITKDDSGCNQRTKLDKKQKPIHMFFVAEENPRKRQRDSSQTPANSPEI